MTDQDVLDRVRTAVGGLVYGPYQYAAADGVQRKPFWFWSVQSRNDVERVTALFEPWLGKRRRERLEQLGRAVEWHIGSTSKE